MTLAESRDAELVMNHPLRAGGDRGQSSHQDKSAFAAPSFFVQCAEGSVEHTRSLEQCIGNSKSSTDVS